MTKREFLKRVVGLSAASAATAIAPSPLAPVSVATIPAFKAIEIDVREPVLGKEQLAALARELEAEIWKNIATNRHSAYTTTRAALGLDARDSPSRSISSS